jgi:hypothetical protein
VIPEWVVKILESGGLWGAIVFVLLLTVMGLVAYVRSMQSKADKVYGYRLAERDTMQKVVGDTAKVLDDLLKAQEDRNDLTEEQAGLIKSLSQAFEILKITIAGQYENIRDHNHVASQAVTSMADAIRTLTAMVVENRTIATAHVQDVKALMQAGQADMKKAITDASQAHIVELRSLLGNGTIVHKRKRPLK